MIALSKTKLNVAEYLTFNPADSIDIVAKLAAWLCFEGSNFTRTPIILFYSYRSSSNNSRNDVSISKDGDWQLPSSLFIFCRRLPSQEISWVSFNLESRGQSS